MKINISKCGIMFLSNSKQKKYEQIKGIPVVGKYKFLGITIDNKLNPKHHTKHLREKIMKY